MAADESPDVQVRLEDQQEINLFGRLNSRKVELQGDIVEVEVRRWGAPCNARGGTASPFHPTQKRLSDLENAEEAVLLADETAEGSTKILIGEAFCDFTSDAAAQYVQDALTVRARCVCMGAGVGR